MEQSIEKSRLLKAGFVLLIILTAYYATKIITEVKGYNYIGGGATASNTMTFNGTGDVSGTPDLATISFTIQEDATLAKDAQTKVTTKEAAVLAFLDKSGIAKKDIKTENYNSYPKYEYRNSICPQYPAVPMMNSGSVSSGSGAVSSYVPVYCPPGKSILTGYEVSENISVKVHDLTKAGDIVSGITNVGISNLNGPSFSIENQDKLTEQARKIAIDDAQAKAKTLASDLGVHLVRIVNFSENGNYPMMYASKGMALDSVAPSAAPSPILPTGENKITSNVSITYEIR
ncbi:SIMPL domain-containing protein [Candidatus Nomurabacteria bacterium]|nr:SIMPL domain-containing protein [Candidatus Nomurabacteria bacterium]